MKEFLNKLFYTFFENEDHFISFSILFGTGICYWLLGKVVYIQKMNAYLESNRELFDFDHIQF